MKRLVTRTLGAVTIVAGIAVMIFAATLITQLGNLVMVMFTIGVFAIGLMTVFGGIDIVKGGSVKDFFFELFDVIARLGR